MIVTGDYLLDTNVVIALFAADESVGRNLGQAAEVFVSATVLGELHFGARKSARAQTNIQRIDEFSASVSVLVCDEDTSRHYGQIKHALGLQGTPLPENDIWIAATAMQHGLTLVTRDAHFRHVLELSIEEW